MTPDEARKVREAAFQAYESANFGADSEMTKGLTDMAREYLAPQGGRPGTARQAHPVVSRRAASGPCSRAPGSRRSRGRTSRWRRRRSSSSPNADYAPPTASSTNSTPSSTEPASTPPTTCAASTSTAPGAAVCATTGATARRRYLGTVVPGLPEPVHAVRTQHQRRHLDHLHPGGAGGLRPADPRRHGCSRGGRRSTSGARSTTDTTPRSSRR